MYIGQSINIEERFKSHKEPKRIGKQHPLYNSIRKYGIENFEFVIIEVVTDYMKLDDREQYWMDYYKSYDRNYGYNLIRLAKGIIHSSETKEIMSLLAKERMKNEELREKISNSVKNVFSNPEFIKKFKKIVKEATNTPEHKKKCSERQKRLCQDPIYLKNISQKNTKNWKNTEYRENYSAKMKIKNQDPKRKEQLSEQTKKLWTNPIYRNKMLESRKHSEEKRLKTIEDRKLFDPDYSKNIQNKKIEASLKNGHTKIHLIDKDKVIRLYINENYELKEVAKIMNLSFGLLAKFLKLNNIKKRKLKVRKVKSDITDEQLHQICDSVCSKV